MRFVVCTMLALLLLTGCSPHANGHATDAQSYCWETYAQLERDIGAHRVVSIIGSSGSYLVTNTDKSHYIVNIPPSLVSDIHHDGVRVEVGSPMKHPGNCHRSNNE